MKLHEFVQTWQGDHLAAAAREGWRLLFVVGPNKSNAVVVQRIDDPEDLPSGVATHLPDDATAQMMVRTGTGEHHAAARKIIFDHFPAEWALLEAAAAAVQPARAAGMSPAFAAPYGAPTTLSLLRAAVQAKIAFWNASRALELHLGFDDVPDAVDAAIQEEISGLAAFYPEDILGMEAVTDEHVAQLLAAIEKAK